MSSWLVQTVIHETYFEPFFMTIRQTDNTNIFHYQTPKKDPVLLSMLIYFSFFNVYINLFSFVASGFNSFLRQRLDELTTFVFSSEDNSNSSYLSILIVYYGFYPIKTKPNIQALYWFGSLYHTGTQVLSLRTLPITLNHDCPVFRL